GRHAVSGARRAARAGPHASADARSPRSPLASRAAAAEAPVRHGRRSRPNARRGRQVVQSLARARATDRSGGVEEAARHFRRARARLLHRPLVLASGALSRDERRLMCRPSIASLAGLEMPAVVELLWEGKYRDGVRVEPSRDAAPLETDEVHDPHDAPDGGPSCRSDWSNRLVLGDQERVLPALAAELAGRVALVYIDPPFDTGGAFDFRASIPGAPDDTPRIAVPAYEDARGLDAWLAWFDGAARRLFELLADGGSLYVHLDAHVAHYAKVVLDEIFGQGAFQREIVWRIGWVSGFKSQARGWIRNHDTLLFYAKGGRPATFHKEYVPYPPGYVRRDGKPPRGAGYPIEDVWNGSDVDRMDSIQIVSF